MVRILLVTGHAASDGHPSIDDGTHAIEFVRSDEHGTTGCGCIGDQGINDVSTRLVEASMRLVEKPELRTA
jgi:hypothetical protein